MSGWHDIAEAVWTFIVPSASERTPSWLGGAVVVGVMAFVIVGLLILRVVLT